MPTVAEQHPLCVSDSLYNGVLSSMDTLLVVHCLNFYYTNELTYLTMHWN